MGTLTAWLVTHVIIHKKVILHMLDKLEARMKATTLYNFKDQSTHCICPQGPMSSESDECRLTQSCSC